ncbi:unnamed protein product [marine sediment metagenome]|uniref:VTT domain-containing protein n=1 Tax=marine sediment metagenome TaxID=412755 RepID=X0T3H0_9ZZZZ
MKINKSLIIKSILGIGIVAGIWWIVRCQCVNLTALTPAAIRDYIQSFGKLAALVYIIAYVLNTVSILPPIGILSLSAGLAFGETLGFACIMIGAAIGTSATFFISRYFGRGFIEKGLKGGVVKKLDDILGKHGFLVILFFRIFPIPPFLYETLNYASGLTKIKFKDFFVATLIGIIPGAIAASFFGGALGEVRKLSDIISPKFIIAAFALALIISLPIIYQRIKRKKRVNHGK